MNHLIENIINSAKYTISEDEFRNTCKATLDQHGVLVMPGFLKPDAIESIRSEGDTQKHLAFYTDKTHNIYLSPSDPAYPEEHPRNREVTSSKGCITTDQIPAGSALHSLYASRKFRDFLRSVLNERELHQYADYLSSINLHYASAGQELGWHFDNSSFAITLMIQSPESGGAFEYVKDVRDADAGEMNYELSEKILNGELPAKTITMNSGTLVLFRGRNSMHRVTPVVGDRTRMLVVLAYNTKPGVSLSESARMTFYGRLA